VINTGDSLCKSETSSAGTELSASGTFRFPSSEEDRKLSAELELELICETDSVLTLEASDDPESAETAHGDNCLFFEV